VSAAPERFHQLDSPSAWELVLVSLFLTVVSYVALGANLFRGEIVAPMDLLLSGEAWPDQLHTEMSSTGNKPDILDAWLPRRIHVKSCLQDGELPLRNPPIAGGQPAFPLLFDSYISPSFLLFLLLPDGLGYTLGLLMRLSIAGLVTFLLCQLSLPTPSSVFGAVTFMLCGFNLSRLMWPQVATSCWIPWVVWSFVRLMSRPSAGGIGLLAIATALMIFGGFPAVAGFALYPVALLFLWMLFSVPENRPRTFRLALVTGYAMHLGFLLTGFQLLPGIEYLKTVDLSRRRALLPIARLQHEPGGPFVRRLRPRDGGSRR